MSSWPLSSACPWQKRSTRRVARAAGSCARSKPASGGWIPARSTCTRCTGPTGRPTSRRPSRRSRTSSGTARSGPSAPPPSPPTSSSRRSGPPSGVACCGSATEQPRYSVLTRIIERDVLPSAQRHGMGVLSYGPLSSGWLSGRADPAAGHRAATVQRNFDMSLPANQRRAEVVAGLAGLAAQAGISLPHLALGFVRATPPSRPSSSGRGHPGSSMCCSARPTSRCQPESSTASMTSSRPGPRSTRPTTTTPIPPRFTAGNYDAANPDLSSGLMAGAERRSTPFVTAILASGYDNGPAAGPGSGVSTDPRVLLSGSRGRFVLVRGLAGARRSVATRP